MNKKADITIMILVIGIVGICILTILSFVKLNNDIDENFLGIGLIETMNSVVEELEFYKETDFEGDYGKTFIRGNVEIVIGEKDIIGIYTLEEEKIIRGCDGGWFEFLEKCTKEFVKVIYTK